MQGHYECSSVRKVKKAVPSDVKSSSAQTDTTSPMKEKSRRAVVKTQQVGTLIIAINNVLSWLNEKKKQEARQKTSHQDIVKYQTAELCVRFTKRTSMR